MAIATQHLIDAHPTAMMVVDAHHQVVAVNNAMVETLGQPAQDLVGRYCPQACHGLDYPFPGCPLEEARDSGGRVDRLLREDVTGSWVSSSVWPLGLKSEGGVDLFLHTYRDDTAVVEARRLARFQSVVADLLRILLHDGDLDDKLRRALPTILGISDVDLEPRGAILLADRDGASLRLVASEGLGPRQLDLCANVPEGHCLCGQVLTSGTLLHCGVVDDRHDIRPRDMEAHGHYVVPIRASSKEVLGVLNLYICEGHRHDEGEAASLLAIADVLAGIIERERRAIRLRDSEALFRGIASSARDAIVLIDADGRVEFWNDAAVRMFGYSASEATGADIFELAIPSAERTIRKEEVRRLLTDTDEGAARQFLATRRDGGAFPAEATGAIVELDGRTLVMGILRDCTEREQMTETLARSAQLATIGTLAASVAHEMNSPLCYAKLAIESAEVEYAALGRTDGESGSADKDDALDELGSCLGMVHTGLDRVLDIASELRSLARTRSGDLAPCDVAEILDGAVDIARARFKHAVQVSLVCSHAGQILANKGQLGQVFLNLVVNAGQALAGRPDATIVVRTWSDEDHLVAEVSDNGPGIAPERMGSLFEPFTSSKGDEGLGLGLWITRNIVMSHGGEIEVDSRPGEGATFRVQLPVGGPEQAPDDTSS